MNFIFHRVWGDTVRTRNKRSSGRLARSSATLANSVFIQWSEKKRPEEWESKVNVI